MSKNRCWTQTFVLVCTFGSLGMVSSAPANADDLAGHCCVDWNKLNLTQTQSQQIDQLNGQWSKDYNEIKPVISDDQQKLQKLLADHNSDPVEVMALQQQIARKREQLNGLATANYLRKRQVLNENQQFNLEQMIKAMVAKRQAQLHPNQHTETVVTDRIQNLMNRARNIWPVQAER